MNSTYAPELTQWQDEAATASGVAEIQAVATPLSTPAQLQDEDPWGVWPYIWFVDLHAFCRQCFHSFHGSPNKWRMERHNRRQQKQFWAQQGFRPLEDEMGLELL